MRLTIETRWGMLCPAILLLAWESSCRAHLVDPVILPAPSDIVWTLVRSVFGAGDRAYPIARNTLASLELLAIGFPLGAALGILAGVTIGLSETAYRVLGPILGLLLPVPAIAWTPIAMVWLGLGAPSIIAIVVYACFSEVVYNTATGVQGTPIRFRWVVESFGGGFATQLRRVVLPAAFPQILVGLKLGLAASWRSLIGTEMFAGVSFGLGYMLYQAHEFYATDVMFSSLIIVALFSLLIEQVGFRLIERRTLARWGMARTLDA